MVSVIIPVIWFYNKTKVQTLQTIIKIGFGLLLHVQTYNKQVVSLLTSTSLLYCCFKDYAKHIFGFEQFLSLDNKLHRLVFCDQYHNLIHVINFNYEQTTYYYKGIVYFMLFFSLMAFKLKTFLFFSVFSKMKICLTIKSLHLLLLVKLQCLCDISMKTFKDFYMPCITSFGV